MKKTVLLSALFLLAGTLYAQWNYSGIEATCNAVQFVNSSSGFASTGYTLARSTDGGLSWLPVASAPMDSIFTALSFPSETTGYAAGLGGNLVKTTDGGNTWAHLHAGTGKDFHCIFFTDDQTGYVAGEDHSLFKTSDGGITWQPLTSPAGTAWSMQFLTASFGFMTGNTNSIFRTQDGGANWLPITFTSPKKYLGIHFPDASTGYAVGMENALTPCLIKSTDGGMKWTEIPITTGKGLWGVFFTDSHTGYACGAGGTIIKTTDGGASWVQQTTPNPGTIYTLFFTDASHGFAAGVGLLRTDNGGGASGIFDNTFMKPLMVSPNPASGFVTISTVIPGNSGRLTISDVQGRVVKECMNCEFPLRLDISPWPAGLYLVRIEREKETWSGRFIKE